MWKSDVVKIFSIHLDYDECLYNDHNCTGEEVCINDDNFYTCIPMCKSQTVIPRSTRLFRETFIAIEPP